LTAGAPSRLPVLAVCAAPTARRLATSQRHSTMVKAVKRKAEDLGYGLAESKSLQEMTPQELKYMNAEFDMVANNKKLAERAIKMLTDQKGIGVGCQVDLFEHGLQTATRCYNDLIARTKVRACRTPRRAG
jgi:trans-aconitate methyltransferase